MAGRIFERAHSFHIETFQMFETLGLFQNPMSTLEARVAAGAIHDSAERCDAPKCHPKTRVDVQEDLYRWIIDGDIKSGSSKKMKWMTGPAGSGKSAVLGSLADRCSADGILVATFFFASWSPSIGRRRKTALIPTIAYQLAQHREDLESAISTAVEKNPLVFEKKLDVQMEVLILTPLREVASGPRLQGAIIIDGLDECKAEEYHDITSPDARRVSARTHEQDQQEILEVLLKASSDPTFPFRILVSSRPERVFREFFDLGNDPSNSFPKIDLHQDYDADVDITLFLNAQFSIIRDRYKLPYSWPPPGVIKTLVRSASGQFIYAAIIARFIAESPKSHPDDQLQMILTMASGSTLNPFEQLDRLYSHILESSPKPILAVIWIRSINLLRLSASFLNLLFQTKPGEAEHLLGSLHSLIQIPPPGEQATSTYTFYHKSLFDFLEDRRRCGKLHVEDRVLDSFIWGGFLRACTRGHGSQISYPENLLKSLIELPLFFNISVDTAVCSHLVPTTATIDWQSILDATGIAANQAVQSGAVAFCVSLNQLLGLHLACSGGIVAPQNAVASSVGRMNGVYCKKSSESYNRT